jgi:hypothetical protein
MKRLHLLFCIGIILFLSTTVLGSAPRFINFQGSLSDINGPVNDPNLEMVFSIYSESDGGIPLWTETNTVEVIDGYYNVLLGNQTPFPDDLFGNEILYLGIKVGSDPEMTPRIQIGSNPSALHALRADSAGHAQSADSAGRADSAQRADSAGSADHAQRADSAGRADSAQRADSAGSADHAQRADSAGRADSAQRADSAGNADHALRADTADVAYSVVPDSIDSSNIKDGSILLIDLGQNGASDGQIIKWDGTAWSLAYDEGGSVGFLPLAGGTMTGPISSTGDPEITMGKGNFGSGNINTGTQAFVAGSNNRAWGAYSVVSGGGGASFADSNSATFDYSTVSGGSSNIAGAYYSTVSGGRENTANGTMATVGGGGFNMASGNKATVGGGESNTASYTLTTVGGGGANEASSDGATVGGGLGNKARGQFSVVSGGGGTSLPDSNVAYGDYSVISGGKGNLATHYGATISGGTNNTANGAQATVGGGNSNTASGLGTPTVGGGNMNTASGSQATVGGGDNNTASQSYATVGGGENNTANQFHATVGGGRNNMASGEAATVSGGEFNAASGDHSVVCGGGGVETEDNGPNVAIGDYSTVGGGGGNNADGRYSTIGGGKDNSTGPSTYPGNCTVAGGEKNKAVASYSTVGGGFANTTSGTSSTIGGGNNNTASGVAATVSGGYNNIASGYYSFAAGQYASAMHDGAFVWADGSWPSFQSERAQQFRVSAFGGARFDVKGNRWVNIWDDGTNLISTSTGARLTLGGTWTNASDRNLKENFTPIDGKLLLEKLSKLPITTWNYRNERSDIKHIGPMAQDFYALFGVGDDDKSISTIDPSGIALAAIQELYKTTQKLNEKNLEMDELKERVNKLEGLVQSLCAELKENPTGDIVKVISAVTPGNGAKTDGKER